MFLSHSRTGLRHTMLHRAIVTGLSIAGLTFPFSAFAANPQGGQAGGFGPGIGGMWAQICQSVPFCGKVAASGGPAGTVLSFAQRVVDLIYPLIAVAGVLMIVYAGIKVVLSQGNDEGITAAKDVVKYALIGIVLGILAKEILDFVIVVLNAFV